MRKKNLGNNNNVVDVTFKFYMNKTRKYENRKWGERKKLKEQVFVFLIIIKM